MNNTQKVSWINSIQTRVALITMFIVTVILGGAAFYNAYQAKKSLTDELNQLAVTTADRLANHLVNPLWDLDKDQIDKALAAEMKEQRIYVLIVKDSDGKTIFANAKRDESWQPVNDIGAGFSLTGVVQNKREINYGEEKVGAIEVYLTDRFLNAELQSSYISSVLQLIVLDVIIFLTMFMAMKKIVITPINVLSQAAEAMSKGDFNATIDLKKNDEIGQVARSMERMKVSLTIAMNKMRPSQAA